MSIGLRHVCTLALLVCSLACSERGPGSHAVIASELSAALEHASSADAIVTLREPRLDDPADRKAAIADISEAVRANLGTSLQLSYNYANAGAFAGRITPQALELLRDDPNVQHVQLVGGMSGLLRESVPAVGVDKVRRSYGLTGRGVRVAFVDSGSTRDHPDLKGAAVVEHCFGRSGACGLLQTTGTDATDGHGHGTGVAGVIASRGVQGPPGFAPEAELVVLKAMDANNRGNEADVTAAIEWIYENLADLRVSVLNLSLGSDLRFENSESCEPRVQAMARAIHNLIEAGVTVIAGSGNAGSTTDLPSPACISGVLAVGSTYDADVGPAPPSGGTFATAIEPGFAACRDETTRVGQISCYTNAPPRLDLIAPGGPMDSAARDGGTSTHWGTSFACAAVSGIAALLYQCNPKLDPELLAKALTSTGELHIDARTGRAFPFVRVPEATKIACPDLLPAPGTMPPPPPSQASDSGAAGAPQLPAADAGKPAETSGSAMPKERDPSKLQGQYTGAAPVDPLRTRPKVSTPPSVAVDAGVKHSAAGGGEVHTERVSSCSAVGGSRGAGVAWPVAWFAVLLVWWSRRRVSRTSMVP